MGSEMLTRDEARAYFKDHYMQYTEDCNVFIAYPIHKSDMQKLYELCEKHLNIDYGQMSMTMSKKYQAVQNRNSAIGRAFLFVDGEYFKKREAISFNRDGFIGFAGWASDKDVQPFLYAFIEWVDWFVKEYGETVCPA